MLSNRSRSRLPLMALAMIALLGALWSGLLRLGWTLPPLQLTRPMAHGPLMVCGFLGTLISLERAVALGRPWAYAAPLLTGLGGLLLVLGLGGPTGPALVTAGSTTLAVIFGVFLRMQNERFAQVMALGAGAWLIGNVMWLGGAPVFTVVPWWMGFLILTIAGERLELSRMLMHAPSVQRQFLAVAALLAVGLVATTGVPNWGWRLTGIALIALSAWLSRYDVARYTIRQHGLTRYIAACLLSGYVWLGLGGALAVTYGPVTAGLDYDAVLHAVFVGFVFAMIFGHAPIIFPSVLGLSIPYRPFLYAPLVLLHGSLGMRIAGDVTGWLALRRWGGLLNAAAIVLFLGSMVYAMLKGSPRVLTPPAPSQDMQLET